MKKLFTILNSWKRKFINELLPKLIDICSTTYLYNNMAIIIQVANYSLVALEIMILLGIVSNPITIIITIASIVPLSIMGGYMHDFIMNIIQCHSEDHIDITTINYDEISDEKLISILIKYPRALSYVLANQHAIDKINNIKIIESIIKNINPYNYNLVLDLFEKSNIITAVKELKSKNKAKLLTIAVSHTFTEIISYTYALFLIAKVSLFILGVSMNTPILLGFLFCATIILTPLVLQKIQMLKAIYSLKKEEDNNETDSCNIYLNNLFYAILWAYIWYLVTYALSSYLITILPLILPYAALIIPITTFAIFLSLLFNFEDYIQNNENILINISVIILYTSICMGIVKVSIIFHLIHINVVNTTITTVMAAQIMPCLLPLIIFTIIAIPIFANFPKILINDIRPSVSKSYKSSIKFISNLSILSYTQEQTKENSQELIKTSMGKNNS